MNDTITPWLHRQAAAARRHGERLAAEIVAAVIAGDELPDEWYSVDAYADCGEPYAELVAAVVRDELSTTPISV